MTLVVIATKNFFRIGVIISFLVLLLGHEAQIIICHLLALLDLLILFFIVVVVTIQLVILLIIIVIV